MPKARAYVKKTVTKTKTKVKVPKNKSQKGNPHKCPVCGKFM